MYDLANRTVPIVKLLYQVARKTLHPEHQLRFTGELRVFSMLGTDQLTSCLSKSGTVVWRTLIPKSLLAHLPDITPVTSWWYSEVGHAYFSGVEDAAESRPAKEDLFELSVRSVREPEISEKTVSWGIPVTNERVQSRFVVCVKFILA
jgi:salicylate hydroxylase